METAETVLEFWFGTEPDDARVAAARAGLWWGKSDETDREISERFGPTLERLDRGELESWAGTPRGTLALVILADQFSRNIDRGTPRAFARDPAALALCLGELESGGDRSLRPIERVFLYLPLEHSERLEHQERSVELFEALAAGVAESARSTFEGFADYARRHRDVVARFGRFPHRNTILGRPSTPEEIEFLKQPGSSF